MKKYLCLTFFTVLTILTVKAQESSDNVTLYNGQIIYAPEVLLIDSNMVGIQLKKGLKEFEKDEVFSFTIKGETTVLYQPQYEKDLNVEFMTQYVNGLHASHKDYKKWPWIVGGFAAGFVTGYYSGAFYTMAAPAAIGLTSMLLPVKVKRRPELKDFEINGYKKGMKRKRFPTVALYSSFGLATAWALFL